MCVVPKNSNTLYVYYKVWQNWKNKSHFYFDLLDYECIPKAIRIIQDWSSDLILCPGTEAQEHAVLFITWWPTEINLTVVQTILQLKQTCLQENLILSWTCSAELNARNHHSYLHVSRVDRLWLEDMLLNLKSPFYLL